MSGRARPRVPGVVWIGAAAGGVGAVAVIAAGGGPTIPAVFIALALGMALLALSALYQSLRSAFTDSAAGLGLRTRLPERAALLDEKDALLRAIKDISFEHEVGKLSDDDFARLDRAYRTRAKEVLQKLDADLAPFLERAENMLKSEVGQPTEGAYRSADAAPSAGKRGKKKKGKARRDCPSCGTSNALQAKWCKECGAAMDAVACGECGARNEADAKFCNSCAKPLGAPDRGNEADPRPEEVAKPTESTEEPSADEGPGELPS